MEFQVKICFALMGDPLTFSPGATSPPSQNKWVVGYICDQHNSDGRGDKVTWRPGRSADA